MGSWLIDEEEDEWRDEVPRISKIKSHIRHPWHMRHCRTLQKSAGVQGFQRHPADTSVDYA